MAGEDIHLNAEIQLQFNDNIWIYSTSNHNFCASKDCQTIDQPVRILFVKRLDSAQLATILLLSYY